MPINSVLVRNFQSLRSIDLTLGRFTVIVGPSSSGKSAVIRAFRALASTVTGNSAITRGADAAAITARTPAGAITLEYSRGAWRYRLLHNGIEAEYAKLNRSVPEQITAALRISPVPAGGTSLNFAGQFDKPYLLTESGAMVARQLGELTNVDTIYAAVREANRRKAALSATLRTRRTDLDRLLVEAEAFRDLPTRMSTVERAEAHAETAARLTDRIARLSRAVDTLEIAERVLADAEQLPPVPAMTHVNSAAQRLARFRRLLRDVSFAESAVEQQRRALAAAQAEETSLVDEHRRVLVTLGTCPTCRQPVAA